MKGQAAQPIMFVVGGTGGELGRWRLSQHHCGCLCSASGRLVSSSKRHGIKQFSSSAVKVLTKKPSLSRRRHNGDASRNGDLLQASRFHPTAPCKPLFRQSYRWLSPCCSRLDHAAVCLLMSACFPLSLLRNELPSTSDLCGCIEAYNVYITYLMAGDG
jgi:hypothetical protein